MSNNAQATEAAPNILFFKVGTLGSAPLDFPARLATNLEAYLLSSELIRKELLEGKKDMNPGQKVSVAASSVRGLFEARAGRLLVKEDDVVGDIFFNSSRTRLIPQAIARDTGAIAVALDIHTPSSLAEQRVKQWVADEAFEIPVADWEVPPLFAARSMAKSIIRPVPEEELSHVFHIDGSIGTEDMIDQVYEQLVKQGLHESE